jgi:hypothetical protein
MRLDEESAAAFEELVREAEDLLVPGGRERSANGSPPTLAPLGEVVVLLERLFDAEHGALGAHQQVAEWLHALLLPPVTAE